MEEGKRGIAKTIDIETNNLLADMLDFSSFPYKLKPSAKLWCVVIRDIYTDEVFTAKKEEITKEWLQENLKGCKYLIHHNGIKFDLLCLKLFGVLDYTIGYLNQSDTLFGEELKMVDTLIVSRLLSPDRFGGHSLKEWGIRTGLNKTDFRRLCIDKGYILKDAPKGAEFAQYVPEMLTYCITPENKVLNENLDWVEASTLKVGENILGFDEYSEETRSGRRYKTAKVEWIEYEIADVYEVELSSGKKIKTTKEHRWLIANSNHSGNNLRWVETQNLRPSKVYGKTQCSKIPKLFNTWEQDESRDAGWLAGMFDGEGNVSKNWFRLSVSQRPTNTLNRLMSLLEEKNFKISKRLTKKNSDCITILMQGCAAERLEFLGKIKPHRLIENFNFEMLGRVEARLGKEDVVSVKYVGQEEIIKIQTSSRTFICEGYPMHNCIGDTEVTKNTFFALLTEMGGYKGWNQAIKMENKLADLAIRRESLGFWFDKDLAIKCVEDLTQKMEELQNKVNPILPLKPMTKGELSNFTPPNTQFLKSGKPSTHIIKFAERVGGKIVENEEQEYFIQFEDKEYQLPFNLPLKTHTEADISNLDHVKMTLTDVYGWVPSEWAERDLTKDSKKQSISLDKRIKALERWYKDTMEGKYQSLRLKIACERFKVKEVDELFDIIKSRLESDFPVRVPTSPKVRVGVEKELCPNLTKLGEKVEFANDFALFLTYKHRKSSIAGGEIEDMDFDLESPNTGFLSMYREEDGRVPTPAIEIGAASNRYRHIGVANIARASSIYGKEMRSLFGCGEGYIQFGFDYSSLENRVQGGYVRKYEGGEELAKMLLAEKPNDLHSINAEKLGISRSDAKSFGYAILYGASVNKLSKMLNISLDKAKELFDGFWEAVPALKQLKEKATAFWESTGKTYIQGIDGRKIFIRSPHSILNFLFQSGGVICAKYTTVFLMQELEKLGHIIDPFISQPSVCEMISYHDEAQLAVKNGLIKFQTFNTEEEAKEFHKNWKGSSQLSTIKKGTKWYIALPSDVSISLEKAAKKTEDLLKLQFELSFEYDVHKNWWGCH